MDPPLDAFRVPSDINECFYIPNFINPEEEEYLLRKINETSKVNWRSLPERRLQVWGGDIVSNTLIPRPLPGFITNHPPIISKIRNTGAFSNSKHGEPNHIIVNEYHPGQGIMPHEDGPSYHPVVATLSLSSHAVFHYHKYKSHHSSSDAETAATGGKSIDPNPIMSLLLEPRSLIITSKNLYTEHLHSISSVDSDYFHPLVYLDSEKEEEEDRQESNIKIRIANWEMIHDENLKRVVRCGGVLKRGVRVSLTCRDVERVNSRVSSVFNGGGGLKS